MYKIEKLRAEIMDAGMYLRTYEHSSGTWGGTVESMEFKSFDRHPSATFSDVPSLLLLHQLAAHFVKRCKK